LQLRPSIRPQVWAAIGSLSGMPAELWKALLQIEPCQEQLSQLTQAMLSRLRLSCLNRARERRRLRIYLAEWAPLQEIADTLDMQLQQARYLEVSVQPFGTWVLWHNLTTMCRFLALGFQLELYSTQEYQMVYWYLESLCDLRLQLNSAAMNAAAVQSVATQAAAGKKSGAAANKKKSKSSGKPAVGSAATRQELLLVAALRELSCAMMLALGLLSVLGLLPPADLEFTPLSMRFQQRFGVFSQLVQPAPLAYERYVDMCVRRLQALPVEQLVAAVATAFKAAKAALDKAANGADTQPSQAQRQEIASLSKISVANKEFVLSALAPLAANPSEAGGAQKMDFDFATHPTYPILQFRQAATSG